MAAEHDVDMAGGVQPVVRAYIVIDTNILLDSLVIVQALLRILSLPSLESAVHMLIPATVLHELDNQHKNGDERVRHRAREANRFLQRSFESRRHDPLVPFRIQKISEMSEHLRAKATKQDDSHILDCCLRFRDCCQDIWLWTKDQIFGTIAESNDIPVLSNSDLYGMVLAIGIYNDPAVRDKVKAHPMLPSRTATPEDDGGMDVDEDLYFDLPALANEEGGKSSLASGPDGSRSLNHEYWAHYSSSVPVVTNEPFANTPPSLGHSSGFSTPVSSKASGSSLPRPVKLSAYDIHEQLETLIQPLMTYTAVTSPRSDRYLSSLLARLIQTESHLFPNTPERTPVTDAQRNLLMGIDATRTLARYCESSLYDKGARPRFGEVAEAIESLGELCLSGGLGDEVCQGCLALASAVRAS